MSGKKRALYVLAIALVTMLMVPIVSATDSSGARASESVEPEFFGVTIYDAYLSKTKHGDPVDPSSFIVGDTVYVVISYELTRSADLTRIYLSMGSAGGYETFTDYYAAGDYYRYLSWGFTATRRGFGIFIVVYLLSPIGFDIVSLIYSVSPAI